MGIQKVENKLREIKDINPKTNKVIEDSIDYFKELAKNLDAISKEMGIESNLTNEINDIEDRYNRSLEEINKKYYGG